MGNEASIAAGKAVLEDVHGTIEQRIDKICNSNFRNNKNGNSATATPGARTPTPSTGEYHAASENGIAGNETVFGRESTSSGQDEPPEQIPPTPPSIEPLTPEQIEGKTLRS